MNSREKFNAIMSFDPDALALKVEYGFWPGTLRAWFEQGLPKVHDILETARHGDLIRASAPLREGNAKQERVDLNVISYFGLEYYPSKFPFDLSPRFEVKVLEEDDDYLVYTDEWGVTQKAGKTRASVPMFVDYPIKSEEDFYAYRESYDDAYDKRLPDDWEALTSSLRDRDFPIRLGGAPFGFLGLPRHLMGFEAYMISLYTQPDLIREINEFYLGVVMGYWAEILEGIDVDCVFVFEDMAYRQGSLISPAMFREFLSPYYVRLIDFLKQHNVSNIIVDSDGLIEGLIPLWVELGVTGVFPLQAGNDLFYIRERWPRLQLLGGVDKRPLIAGDKDRIDEELRRVEVLLAKGGFIPHIDHSVSSDVSLEDFAYYRERLNEICDRH